MANPAERSIGTPQRNAPQTVMSQSLTRPGAAKLKLGQYRRSPLSSADDKKQIATGPTDATATAFKQHLSNGKWLPGNRAPGNPASKDSSNRQMTIQTTTSDGISSSAILRQKLLGLSSSKAAEPNASSDLWVTEKPEVVPTKPAWPKRVLMSQRSKPKTQNTVSASQKAQNTSDTTDDVLKDVVEPFATFSLQEKPDCPKSLKDDPTPLNLLSVKATGSSGFHFVRES
ncbi:uncharacterized protein LOC129586943 [Paramacrobiotus metropolitanus]|uniref:uncharacterized protein LOC129586943 n=1 Tax=Paramacrobiotus metropolitanus TaxID=2943436 RepID=UPI002445FA5D|nr:uncharacterized protein LOC129586943 [Paramacrobiotus metropolitanus]